MQTIQEPTTNPRVLRACIVEPWHHPVGSSSEAFYGTQSAVTLSAGLHLFERSMLDRDGHRMEHGHGTMERRRSKTSVSAKSFARL
jgi:hypothetical protein